MFYDFAVDYRSITASKIYNIHRHLMRKKMILE